MNTPPVQSQVPPSPPERKTDAASVTGERTDCILNGYWVGEVAARTKGNLKTGWPEMRGLPAADPRYTGTITLCELLRVLDFDIDDYDVLEKVLKLAVACGIPLHRTIYRKRDNGSLHVLFVFRAERPVSSAAWPGKRRFVLKGQGNAIDVLGAGQQFITFNGHPDGSHFEWPHGSPRDRPRHDLPILTEAQIDALSLKLAEAGLLVSDTGRGRPHAARSGTPVPQSLGAPLLNILGQPAKISQGMPARVKVLNEAGQSPNHNFMAGLPDTDVTVDKAITALCMMPNDYPAGHPLCLSRDQWRDLAYSLHWIVNEEARRRNDPLGQFSNDDARMREAFELFSASYTEDPNKTIGSSDKLWGSTRDPRDITAGTFVYMARQRIPDFDSIFEED